MERSFRKAECQRIENRKMLQLIPSFFFPFLLASCQSHAVNMVHAIIQRSRIVLTHTIN